jgi:hypothetical protein
MNMVVGDMAVQDINMVAGDMAARPVDRVARDINMADRGMQVMDIASDPVIMVRLAVIIVTDGLILIITTPILATDILFFGVGPAFGSGCLGSRRSGSVAFIGDLALASSSCPNGKSQVGTLQALPMAMF